MKPWEVIELLAKHVVGKYPCPSGVIGQLILEVGFQLKTPKDMATGRESYNLGNIKGVGPAGSVTIHTTEYYSEQDVQRTQKAGNVVRVVGTMSNSQVKVLVKAQFRAYHNYGEAIADHFALLKYPRYVRAGVWEAKTPRAFAEALYKAGYATDPKYVDKIMSIVNRYQLTRFDVNEPAKQEEALPKVKIYVKDKQYSGYLLDATTWVPVRTIAEGLGVKVEWNGQAAVVNTKVLPTRIEKVNGKPVGHVPVRRLASVLGMNVTWDPVKKEVNVG